MAASQENAYAYSLRLNYFYDERANNNYFQGWRVGTHTYKPGDTFLVEGDTTFIAEWSNSELSRDVNINVVFRDCNDIDGLRPSSINFNVNGTEPITIDEASSWNYKYSGVLETIAPVGDYSQDTETGYRYEIEGDVKTGFTFTFIHTSSEKYTDYPGTITWNDEDNFENLRPGANELTIALVNTSTNEEVATHTFDGSDWSYDFGTNIPVYNDGKLINYRIVVKDTSTWAYKDEYRFGQSARQHSYPKIFCIIIRCGNRCFSKFGKESILAFHDIYFFYTINAFIGIPISIPKSLS